MAFANQHLIAGPRIPHRHPVERAAGQALAVGAKRHADDTFRFQREDFPPGRRVPYFCFPLLPAVRRGQAFTVRAKLTRTRPLCDQ